MHMYILDIQIDSFLLQSSKNLFIKVRERFLIDKIIFIFDDLDSFIWLR